MARERDMERKYTQHLIICSSYIGSLEAQPESVSLALGLITNSSLIDNGVSHALKYITSTCKFKSNSNNNNDMDKIKQIIT